MLVLGGTVFLSRAVAEAAVARGHEVTAACRGASGGLPDGVRHLPLDRAAAEVAGDLAARREAAGRTVDVRDTLIAGIALARRAAVATRNVRHYADLCTGVINPWSTR